MRDTRVRILLLHNPKAGNGDHEAEELVEALGKAGHEATYQSLKEKKAAKKALEEKFEVIIVAGGDGAVGRVARRLIGTNTPLSILPLGTANNLARMLGFTGPANKLIENLTNGERRAFDVGVARGAWGKRYFFEGTGAGLFADYLRSPRKTQPVEPISKAEQMKRHVVELRRELHDYRAKPWKIVLDDEEVSGRYLLWQAMNIRSVGPVLRLAPNAKTDDGQLDFVGALEEERGKLLNYLDARLAGVKPRFPLRPKKFKRMRLFWKKSPLHFDDEVWPEKNKRLDPCEIEITVKSCALTIWRTRK